MCPRPSRKQECHVLFWTCNNFGKEIGSPFDESSRIDKEAMQATKIVTDLQTCKVINICIYTYTYYTHIYTIANYSILHSKCKADELDELNKGWEVHTAWHIPKTSASQAPQGQCYTNERPFCDTSRGPHRACWRDPNNCCTNDNNDAMIVVKHE